MNDKSTENKINRIQKEIEDMERPDYETKYQLLNLLEK